MLQAQPNPDLDDLVASLGPGRPYTPPPPTPEPLPLPESLPEPAPLVSATGVKAPPTQGPRVAADDIHAIFAGSPDELVVDSKTGRVRQAGAVQDEGAFILQYRTLAERELFVFLKGVLGKHWLTRSLHLPACRYLTTDKAKLDAAGLRALGLLFPRDHCKSVLVSQGMPAHMFIQPRDHNIYFPGEDGCDTRIILCCRTEGRAKDHGRVVRQTLESNKLLRAFWPHRVWNGKNGKGESLWNNQEFIVPRDPAREWADPSFRAMGVDGSITGAHPSGLLKDDLIDEHEMKSPTMMEAAWVWHNASRALIQKSWCREWIVGTRWSVDDIYGRMLVGDPTVHFWVRAMIEDGACIWPEHFSLVEEEGKTSIEQIRSRLDPPSLFPLLYMNSAADPTLVDFNMAEVRDLRIEGDWLVFDDAPADAALAERITQPDARPYRPHDDSFRGTPLLTGDTYDRLRARHEALALRAA